MYQINEIPTRNMKYAYLFLSYPPFLSHSFIHSSLEIANISNS